MSFSSNDFYDPQWYAQARNNDPTTSHLAAAQLNRTQVSVAICDGIVRLLRQHGNLTDAEILDRLERDPEVGRYCTPSGLRTRRKSLERRGIVEDSGLRRPGETNRLAIAWRLTTDEPVQLRLEVGQA